MKKNHFIPISLPLLLIFFLAGFTACDAQTNPRSGTLDQGSILPPPPGGLTGAQEAQLLYYAFGNGYRTALGGLGTIVIRDNMKVVKTCMGYSAYSVQNTRDGVSKMCFELFDNPDLNGNPTETYCLPFSNYLQILVHTQDNGLISISVPASVTGD